MLRIVFSERVEIRRFKNVRAAFQCDFCVRVPGRGFSAVSPRHCTTRMWVLAKVGCSRAEGLDYIVKPLRNRETVSVELIYILKGTRGAELNGERGERL